MSRDDMGAAGPLAPDVADAHPRPDGQPHPVGHPGPDGRSGTIATDPDSAGPLSHLRVVVFSDAIPGRNGVGTFYDDLADALEAHVGTIRIIAPEPEPAKGEGGWSIPLPGDPTQRLHIPSVWRLWKTVRGTRPHVVLAATSSVYGVAGLIMAVRLRAGSALCYHTAFPALARGYWTGLRALVVPRVLALWDRLLLRFSPAVLVPNRNLVDTLARKGRSDVRIMGTVAPRAFVETPVAEPPSELRTVTFVGRLAAEKRVGDILEAARRFPNLRFRVVGDGPMRGEVASAAEACDNLTHTPWVGRAEVMDALDGTDLLILPSRHETFGTAAFEAMIRGRPVLASPACGITGWPRLVDALFVMRPDEDVGTAIGRLRAIDGARLRDIATRARAAALAVHAESVDTWLDLLATLSKGR